MNRVKKIKSAVIVSIFLLMSFGSLWWAYSKFQIGVYIHDSFKNKHNPIIDLAQLNGKTDIVPLLVLGSGPASLSAALYGSRSGIKTFVLRGNQPGGQLTGTSYIENWPGTKKIRGAELMTDFEDQVRSFGTVLLSDAAVSVDLSSWPYKVKTEEGHELYALSLMIATGATPRRLSIPGEQEYWGKGVTTCAICDAPYHKGDRVVVIGGGDSAMEEALELSPYAKQIDILVRGTQLRASVSMIERVKDCTNVTIHYNKSVAEVLGDGAHMTSAIIKDTVTGSQEEWPVKGMFLAIGHIPNTQLFKGVITLDKEGYIQVADRHQMTNVPGVAVAGDVGDSYYRQAGVAAGDGIKAGLDIVWWLTSIGYNASVQTKLESFFFDPNVVEKKKLEEIDSLVEYDNLIANSKDKLIMLDFFTPYCPSCMSMIPIIEWTAAKFSDKVVFRKVDASLAYDLVKKFKVPDVPHMIFIKDGNIIDRLKDTMNRPDFYAFIKTRIA